MLLPQLTEMDIEEAIPNVENVGPPLQGGQKLVFPCTISGQQYALKVMLSNPSPPGEPDEITARARREVEILGKCDCPHIVKIGPIPLEQVNVKGQNIIYFSEEWIDGPSVKGLIQSGHPFLLSQVVKLGKDIAEAIRAIWVLKKIHRDIKPDNIMHRNDPAQYVLLDMGIAFDLEGDSLTTYGAVWGTRHYFSPEQSDFEKKRQMDFRSDLFSLGIVLYEVATGRHPFWRRGMSDLEVISIIKTNPAAPPSSLRAEIPPQMEAVIMRLLDKSPHMRYRDFEMLIGAFEAIPTGEGS